MKKNSNIRELNSEHHFTKWFEEVYDVHFERLFRYAFSITKNKQLAEDVVSEVFTNIWKNKPDYDSIRELNSYLHVSVKHLAIRQVSKDPQRFSYSTYDETLQISDSIDPESLLLGKELGKIIERILDTLSPHSRLVYDMARTEGKSYQEIADELGITKRTAETHVHQVLKKLKVQLREHFKDTDNIYHFFTHLGSIAGLLISLWLCFYR
ncbi:sigma-70 family RNA polymerase sigma factor [Gilvimarinus agarilyticus]|uniref:RNA polymerase sigma-70 factor, ECF subfamily n=1 Tax=Reichenbachiella agariperforans TaxID=156994 RepID=A0A1M6S1I7_REIAG|nr:MULTISPECIES: sigma-70 family RNA polymerase sigma factor [Reichenbachiella]MBU2884743.1 sigma-70 family RNA polymerase sigma factor [Gilvimarinus agarilyticus]MBU2914935.1 sigma-70 family RNA polymerase sigma factor [Reichenbachiella agariperforans]RJE70367.1 hypothetical protein BGP76_09730 [Reichenbachiella sp. MSK19-1]SHK38580.1 RNA polymerase sigma-70 factor, ECF subfamily [Reichenbachiella agariperforans]